jgi:hypothetical protein
MNTSPSIREFAPDATQLLRGWWLLTTSCLCTPPLESRLTVSPIPPHPNPLPKGEGETSAAPDFRILGTCPAPADGAADITSLYTARYGVPKAGTKVYVQVNQVVDGWESLPRTYSAIVPPAA